MNSEQINPLNNLEKKEYIYIFGAGGKTSFIKYLRDYFHDIKKKCIISTTTKFAAWQFKDDCIIDEKLIYDGGCYVKAINRDNNKLIGYTPEILDDYFDKNDYSLFVEADGAQMLPIKYPEEYEPVISRRATKFFLILGLDALDKQLDKSNFHRLDILKKKHPEFSQKNLIDLNLFDIIINIYLSKISDENFFVILNKIDECSHLKNQIINFFETKNIHYAISSFKEKSIEWIK